MTARTARAVSTTSLCSRAVTAATEAPVISRMPPARPKKPRISTPGSPMADETAPCSAAPRTPPWSRATSTSVWSSDSRISIASAIRPAPTIAGRSRGREPCENSSAAPSAASGGTRIATRPTRSRRTPSMRLPRNAPSQPNHSTSTPKQASAPSSRPPRSAACRGVISGCAGFLAGARLRGAGLRAGAFLAAGGRFCAGRRVRVELAIRRVSPSAGGVLQRAS